MSRIINISAIAFVVSLTGCGGGGEKSSATVATPTTFPQTTTTIDPISAAADYYMEIVTPSNCARELYNLTGDTFNSKVDERSSSGEWDNNDEFFHSFKFEVIVFAEKYSDALLQLASDLGTYVWPDSVQTSVDELITQMLDEADIYAQYSKISSYSQLQDWEWPYLSDANPAGVIRAKLGLPSNVNSDVNYCKKVFG